jgi:acyl carrier protein
MTDRITTRVIEIAADIFEEPAQSLDESSSPQTILRWDSVQHLVFTLAVEEEFGIQFPPEDLEELVTLGAVADAVRRHGAAA